MEGSLIFYGTNLEDAFGNQNWVSNISYSCQTTKDSGISCFSVMFLGIFLDLNVPVESAGLSIHRYPDCDGQEQQVTGSPTSAW